MGLFTSSKKNNLPWINVQSVEQLDSLLTDGSDKPKLMFKHSTRCGISSMALNTFESAWESGDELCELYFVDLLKHRDVSNRIAELTGITHQSPQVIVVKGSEIIYDASHSGIDGRRITRLLKEA